MVGRPLDLSTLWSVVGGTADDGYVDDSVVVDTPPEATTETDTPTYATQDPTPMDGGLPASDLVGDDAAPAGADTYVEPDAGYGAPYAALQPAESGLDRAGGDLAGTLLEANTPEPEQSTERQVLGAHVAGSLQGGSILNEQPLDNTLLTNADGDEAQRRAAADADEQQLVAEMNQLGHRGLTREDGIAFASGPRLTPEQSELVRELNVAQHMQQHPGMDRAAAERDLERLAEFQRKDEAWSAVDARIAERLREPAPPEGLINLTPQARADLIRREEYERAMRDDPTLGPRPTVFRAAPGAEPHAPGAGPAIPFDRLNEPSPLGRGETPLAHIRPGDAPLGQTAPSRVQDVYRQVNEFLGGDAYLVRSNDGSAVYRSRVPNADGSFNQFRADRMGVPGPDGAHFHLETVRPEGGRPTRLGTEFGPATGHPRANNGHFYTYESSPPARLSPARPAPRLR